MGDGLPHLFMYTQRSATDHEIFVDGVSVGTSSQSKTIPTLDETGLGHWKGTEDYPDKGYDFRVHSRGHTAVEALEAFVNPWDLYWEKSQRTYIFPAHIPAVVAAAGVEIFRRRIEGY